MSESFTFHWNSVLVYMELCPDQQVWQFVTPSESLNKNCQRLWVFLYSAGRIKSACLVWVNNWFWLALSVYCLMLRTCNSVKLLTASCRHLNIRNCIRCQNMYCTKPHAAYAAPLSLLILGRFRLWLTTHGLSLVHDCLGIDLGTATWLDNIVKNTVRLCGL